MCGIVGFCGNGDRETIERMARCLTHRGPDADGFFLDPSARVALGHRRLKIIDLEGGVQPLFNEDRTKVVIFNGEIYNFRALRTLLEERGHVFSTRSDTEVLLHGYEEWGDGLLKRISGMYAFALFDTVAKTLFLARDPFGKKPLFYHFGESTGEFVFGSELKALLQHPSVRKSIDRVSLGKYFSFGYVPAPGTILEGVRKLPAGHFLKFGLSPRSLELERFWKPCFSPKWEPAPGENDSLEMRLRDRLETAVRSRLFSDVPLGVFLSGGIDSGAVAAFAVRNSRERVKTFSMGFHDPSFDESPFARQVASFLGTEHHERVFSERDLLATAPEVLGRLDEPMADPSLLPTFMVSRFAREHVTVVLTGDGGDEIFAGYDPFKAQIFADILDRFRVPRLYEMLFRLSRGLPTGERNIDWDFKIKRFLMGMPFPPLLRHNVWMSPLLPAQIGRLIGEPQPADSLYSEVLEYAGEVAEEEPVDRFVHLWMKTYLQDDILVKADRASMMVSLEARSPFLDKDLVAFVARLPVAEKFRKRILKRALAGLLPESIIARPKKGFGIPLTGWLKRELRELMETYTGPRFLKDFGLDERLVGLLKRQHLESRADQRLFLWALIVLSFWWENL